MTTLLLAGLAVACAPPQARRELVTQQRAEAGPAIAALPAQDEPAIVINELMARNDSVLMDESLDRDDWAEILNISDGAVDLEGWGLSDDPDDEAQWSFPAGSALGPGERLVVWLDGEESEGALHTSFSLSADEDSLALYSPDGAAADAVAFQDLGADLALGRFPDGVGGFYSSNRITPYNRNPRDPGQDLDPSEALFAGGEVLDLALWLPDDSVTGLNRDPDTYVEAGLGFEGVWLEPVGVRIKGSLGSLRTLGGKAAFRVKIDAYEEDARLRGLSHLTLNNMVQDPSFIHEHLAYAALREAGVPAPRNTWVALNLNGEYKGLYLSVETHDKSFLSRWFEDEEGNLYEGEYGQDATLSSYEALDQDQQGADDVDDRSDLLALATLLAQTPDEALVPDLEALVDVDSTLLALAGEVLAGHWDGYFYYPNNYRLYHDPSTGRFTLLPWGMDQTYGYEGSLSSAKGRIASWCLAVPSLQQRFWLALWRVTDIMRATEVETEVETWGALLSPYIEADPHYEYSVDVALEQMDLAAEAYRSWPETVIGQIFPDGEPQYK